MLRIHKYVSIHILAIWNFLQIFVSLIFLTYVGILNKYILVSYSIKYAFYQIEIEL